VQESAVPWTTALFNQGRGNVSEEGAVLPLKRRAVHHLWSYASLLYSKKLTLSTSPVVEGSIAYVGNDNGRFYAVDLVKKSTLWHVDTGEHIDTSATVDGELLYIGTGEGIVYALERGSGKELWRYETRAAISSSPLVVGELLYVASADDRIYALDKTSGEVRWQHGRRGGRQVGARVMSSPAGDGERVYHLFSDGHLLAFDGESGTTLWDRPIFDSPLLKVWRGRKTPLLTDKSLFILDGGGFVLQIDRENGDEVKRFGQGRAIDFIVKHDALFLVGDDSITAIEIGSGDVKWRQEIQAISPLSLFGAGDYIFLLSNRTYKTFGIKLFAQRRGRIDAFSMKDGGRYSVDEFNSPISANGIFSNNRLLVVVDKGFMLSYSP